MSYFQSTELLISLAGMCGTVGAAIAAYMSARTSEKMLESQNEAKIESLKPYIFLLEKEFSVEYDDREDKRLHLIDWGNFDNEINKYSNSSFIPIVNIGNGISRDVTVESEIIDYKNIFDLINSESDKKIYDKFKIGIGQEKFSSDLLNVFYKAPQKFLGNDDYEFKKINTQTYTLIDNYQSSTIYKYYLPSSFLILYNCFFYFHLYDKINYNDLPKLKLNIKFNDLEGRNYDHSFIVKIKQFNINEYLKIKANFEFKTIEI